MDSKARQQRTCAALQPPKSRRPRRQWPRLGSGLRRVRASQRVLQSVIDHTSRVSSARGRVALRVALGLDGVLAGPRAFPTEAMA